MEITSDKLTFADELQTEVPKRAIKGYYLHDNELVLQIENTDQKIVNRSLMYTNSDEAYKDYVTLVNINSYQTRSRQ